MVFKNKLFFSSSKKSDSSSADGSNSPRSTSNSPIRADKKKAKASTSKLDSKQKSRQQNVESCSGAGNNVSSRGHSGGLKSSDFCTPEISYYCENPKGSESPRSQAILRATSGPRKRGPADIKSFSHELNSKGETLVVIRAKFDKAKEEVNSDLAFFAADVVGLLDKNAESHPEWQEAIEELLVLARSCAMTPPGEFWFQCEGIVQELDDRRQELPPCVLKQLYTRMPFILTRCTRLLKFHRECGLAKDENLIQLRQFLI